MFKSILDWKWIVRELVYGPKNILYNSHSQITNFTIEFYMILFYRTSARGIQGFDPDFIIGGGGECGEMGQVLLCFPSPPLFISLFNKSKSERYWAAASVGYIEGSLNWSSCPYPSYFNLFNSPPPLFSNPWTMLLKSENLHSILDLK